MQITKASSTTPKAAKKMIAMTVNMIHRKRKPGFSCEIWGVASLHARNTNTHTKCKIHCCHLLSGYDEQGGGEDVHDADHQQCISRVQGG